MQTLLDPKNATLGFLFRFLFTCGNYDINFCAQNSIEFSFFLNLRLDFDHQADFFALKGCKENLPSSLFQFTVLVLMICKTISPKSAMN